MRKMSDDECPLYLRLCAGPSEKILSLVLKENETGEVNVSFQLSRNSYDKLMIIYTKNICAVHAVVLIKLLSSTVGCI